MQREQTQNDAKEDTPMPSEAEIEAAARALHKRNGFFPEFERASYAAQQEYREDAKAALEAAERVRWQPIESAPRDGTEILIFYQDEIRIVDWTNADGGPRRSYGCLTILNMAPPTGSPFLRLPFPTNPTALRTTPLRFHQGHATARKANERPDRTRP
jgi:hypothetical protein